MTSKKTKKIVMSMPTFVVIAGAAVGVLAAPSINQSPLVGVLIGAVGAVALMYVI